MIEQEPKDDLRLKILLQSSIKVKTDTQSKFIDKIVPLNENQAFLYFDEGLYELYDIEQQQVIGKGQITKDVKYFTQIYPQTLSFLDPEDMKVKLLDLDTHQVKQSFTFEASNVVKQTSEKQQKETLAENFRIMTLDREQDNIRYLITQDLERQYSNNNICHFVIRKIPQKFTNETQFDFSSVFEYNYPNKTGQIELFNWQVDEETFVVFGQDFEVGQAEILLIKPHLMEKAFQIIHIKDSISFTLINVTNWLNPHLIALWQNNNDGNAKPTIFTIDTVYYCILFQFIHFLLIKLLLQQIHQFYNHFIRSYYDGQNWLPEPEYHATKVRDDYVGDEPVTFMDIHQFQLNSTYVLQFRMIGNDPKLSLINYANIDKPELINEVKIEDFFQELPSNRSYLLLYNEQEQNIYRIHLNKQNFWYLLYLLLQLYYTLWLNQEFISQESLNVCNIRLKNGIVEFNIVFPVDARHQLLQIMEKTKLIDKYGINNVEELFEFYQ